MEKFIVYTVILIILAGFLFWGFQTGFFVQLFTGPVKPVAVPEGTLLFYGADCPHCKIVEDYIVKNNIDKIVKYTKLEVPFNSKTSAELEANAVLAIQLAKSCKLSTINGVGIPFLYDGKNCILGQDDVINFFKNAANIK